MSYGFEILKEVGTKTSVVRAGKSNLFLSSLFREAFVNTTGVNLELYDTNGAQGAALGAGVGVGAFQSVDEALAGLRLIEQEAPEKSKQQQYQEAYQEWKRCLPSRL